MAKINSPHGLISNFQTQLEHQWSRFRELEGDDSARGSSYESAFSDLLEEYFGGRFDIFTNCSVMDHSLSCFDAFERGAQNEIDVIGLYNHATPRLVLRERDMKWVPLEGVAFLCEVKSRVDKGRIQSDLQKLSILRELESDPDDRFGVTVSGDYSVDHQLHCLIYDRSSISDETLNSNLSESEVWDLVLLVEDDVLIINHTLPVIEILKFQAVKSQASNMASDDGEVKRTMVPDEENYTCLSLSNGLAWFMLALSGSVPWPVGLTTTRSFTQLLAESQTGMKYSATTQVTEKNAHEWESVDSEVYDEGE